MRSMMAKIPAVVPPLPQDHGWKHHYDRGTAFQWLAAGWHDFGVQPGLSLVYGLAVFIVSLGIVAGLFTVGWDYILFPAFAGFMVVGPILAVGLYEKSRRLGAGEPV